MAVIHFPGNDRSTLSQLRRYKFRNDAGEQAPAFGILRITGLDVSDPEEVFLKIGKPNTFGSQYSHAINMDLPVADGGYGYCTLGEMNAALYDTGDGTPAFGERWGPRTGTWKLKKNTGGFRVMGNLSTTYARVLVTQDPFKNFSGVTSGAILANGTGTVSIFYPPAPGIDTGVDFTGVYNEYADIDDARQVEVVWDGDVAGVKWKIVQAQCPA